MSALTPTNAVVDVAVGTLPAILLVAVGYGVILASMAVL